MNSKINKRLKDALFTDQWSELFMDALSPFHFVLVRRSQQGWATVCLPGRWTVGRESWTAGTEGGGAVGELAGGTDCWRDSLQPSSVWGLAQGLVVHVASVPSNLCHPAPFPVP